MNIINPYKLYYYLVSPPSNNTKISLKQRNLYFLTKLTYLYTIKIQTNVKTFLNNYSYMNTYLFEENLFISNIESFQRIN